MTKRARRVVAAAASAEMPGFIKPQLATLKAKAPSGDQWLHEIKFDGYRVQVHLNKGKKRLFTRNGLDWTKRFSVIDHPAFEPSPVGRFRAGRCGRQISPRASLKHRVIGPIRGWG